MINYFITSKYHIKISSSPIGGTEVTLTKVLGLMYILSILPSLSLPRVIASSISWYLESFKRYPPSVSNITLVFDLVPGG